MLRRQEVGKKEFPGGKREDGENWKGKLQGPQPLLKTTERNDRKGGGLSYGQPSHTTLGQEGTKHRTHFCEAVSPIRGTVPSQGRGEPSKVRIAKISKIAGEVPWKGNYRIIRQWEG